MFKTLVLGFFQFRRCRDQDGPQGPVGRRSGGRATSQDRGQEVITLPPSIVGEGWAFRTFRNARPMSPNDAVDGPSTGT